VITRRATEPFFGISGSPGPDASRHADDLAVFEDVSQPWRRLSAPLVVGACMALLGVLYFSTLGSLVAAWSRDPFGHGFIVVPGVIYLVWRRRARLMTLQPVATAGALPVLAIVSLAWLLGKAGDIHGLQHLAVLAMPVVVTWAVVGSAVVQALAFPFGLLLFALPIDDALAGSLQTMTASVVATMLRYSGVSAVLDRHFIATTATTWDVTEACGGIHYVIAGLAVGYIYAGLVYHSWRHRAAFAAASLLIPFVGNCLRVYATILLDEAGATAVVDGTAHYAFGLLVFAGMITVLVITCGRWHEDENSAGGSPAPHRRHRAWATRRTAAIVGLTVLLVASAPLSARVLTSPTAAQTEEYRARWRVESPWTEIAGAQVSQAVTGRSGVRAFRSGERIVELDLAGFPEGGGDAGEIGFTAADQPSRPAWTDADSRRRAVVLPGRSLMLNESQLRSPQSALRRWTWFVIDGDTTASPRLAKLRFAVARLFRRTRPVLQIAVSIEEQPGTDASPVLADFVAHLEATIAVH
jgi:exosortase